MNEENIVRLFNVEMLYPFLGKVNNDAQYGSGKYEVSCIISKEQAEEIRSKGLSPKQKIKEMDDGRMRITLKSTVQPLVTDASGVKFTSDQLEKIGNGSVGNVRVNLFEQRGQKFAGLSAIRVKKFVEYSGASSTDDLLDDECDTTSSSMADLEDDD